MAYALILTCAIGGWMIYVVLKASDFITRKRHEHNDSIRRIKSYTGE